MKLLNFGTGCGPGPGVTTDELRADSGYANCKPSSYGPSGKWVVQQCKLLSFALLRNTCMVAYFNTTGRDIGFDTRMGEKLSKQQPNRARRLTLLFVAHTVYLTFQLARKMFRFSHCSLCAVLG